MAGGRVTGATVGGETVTADHYVAAVPVEVMRLLAVAGAARRRAAAQRARQLVTRWMNGVMFYLARTSRWSTATRSTSTPSGR